MSARAAERPTPVPESYPELEREVYASLDFVTERETLVPPAPEQVGLAVACALRSTYTLPLI